MHFDDDFLNNTESEEIETGSDDLLSDDRLRLPDEANPLVRLHAVRSWLTRRQRESSIEIGEAAVALQEAQQEQTEDTWRQRRRDIQRREALVQRIQHEFLVAQERLAAFEEAETLLEECITHTTSSERTLVEYYLTLDDLVQEEIAEPDTTSPRHQVLLEVLQRVEQVGTPNDD